MRAQGPLVAQGANGYSVKSGEGQASHYYSQPFYSVNGVLHLPDKDVPVTGQGWLDREWSAQPLASDQTGWDWFSLSFESGARMMGFRLRDGEGYYTSATWIDANGTPTPFTNGSLMAEPLSTTLIGDTELPTRWHITLPEKGVDVTLTALNPNAWMDMSVPYWEGPISITGSHNGRGYLEMTGY